MAACWKIISLSKQLEMTLCFTFYKAEHLARTRRTRRRVKKAEDKILPFLWVLLTCLRLIKKQSVTLNTNQLERTNCVCCCIVELSQ